MLRQRNVETVQKEESSSVGSSGKKNGKLHTKSGMKNTSLKTLAFLLIVLYGVIPVVFYYSPVVRRHALFLSFVAWPPFLNLSNPEGFGFECVRNYKLQSENDIQLGTWHILPHTSQKTCKQGFPKLGTEFNDKRPLVLYLHGNSGTRGGGHRVELYKILSGKEVNTHVIAFDYRGYGDSSTHLPPTAPGVVNDSKAVFKWLLQENKIDPSQIVLWGHSLGTGIACSLIAELAKENLYPGGLILESPLSSTYEAAFYYPVTIFHRYIPYYDTLMAKPLGEHEETKFDNVENIKHVKYPLLVLHAQDDLLLAHDKGRKIYERALTVNKAKNFAQFKSYPADLGYGHKYICRDPEFPMLIAQFINSIAKK